MADTAIAITAGTGTNVDTRTESTNGNHRQVIIIGDPATNAGVAPVDATAGLKVDLGADNDVTVTGTVDLGATDNAVLDAIAASVAAVDTDTTTIIGHVDGIETLLGTMDADTSNISTKIDTIAGDTTSIQTAVELIDDTVYTDGTGTPSKGVAVMGTDGTNPQILKTDASGELQVDVLTMPTVAVTNAGITTIAGAVSGTEMQVDVLTMPTTTVQATNLDIRDLTNADVVTAELSAVDNAVLDAIAASLAGTLTVTGGGGGTEYTEGATDASITGGAILWEDAADTLRAVSAAKPLPVDLGTNNDVTVTGTVDLGATDNAVLDTIAAKDFATQTTLAAINAKLVTGTDIGDVTINNAAGASAVNIQDGGNTITVDGTVAVTNADITSIKTAVEILDNAISGTEMQVDVLTMPTVTVTASNLDVQSGGADLATSTQASAIQTAVQLIDNAIYVDDADWAADTSSHTLVGAVTQATPSANTDGDTTPLITNALRELRTAIPESDLATAATTHVKKYYTNAGAVTDGIVWSPAAGKRWYVTDLIINVSAAATVTFEDDLGAGDAAVMKFELAANSGVSHSFRTPWFSGEDAADLLVTTSAGNIYICLTGYEI